MSDSCSPSSSDPFLQAETNKPSQLLRLFAILSVVSVITIVVLAGTGIYRVFSGEMIRLAEQWSVHIGNAIYEQDRGIFRKSPLPKEDFERIDARMKQFLISFDMYKIKAFSKDKTIIYSTDHAIVGKVEADNSKLDHVLTTGAVVSKLEFKEKVRDLKDEERFRLDVVETYVPVRANGVIVGAFEVYIDITPTRRRIVAATEAAIVVLTMVLVAVFGLLYIPMRKGTLSLKEAHKKLTELASLDGLTGIFNRRYLMDRVSEERDRMLRTKLETVHGRMAFILADIDHFKKVNDVHGHLAGDAVLREVSNRLKKCMRSYDVLGRYGGEEFLVMLPNTDLEAALVVANRMHLAIASSPVNCNELQLAVTISIGVTDTLAAGEAVSAAINRADEALYVAKDSGRNRVCCSATGDTPSTPASPAPT